MAALIEALRDVALAAVVLHEAAEDPAHDFDLVRWARDLQDAVGLNAFLLAVLQLCPGSARAINQLPPQSVARRPTLMVAQLDQLPLPREDFGRELAAVLAGHSALGAFDDRGDWTAVVLEAVGAVRHRDAGTLAEALVTGPLVSILEAAPADDVVDQDQAVVGPPFADVVKRRLQPSPAGDAETAAAVIRLGSDDLDATGGGQHRLF